MEALEKKIRRFVAADTGYGSGFGYGRGSGSSDGSGSGYGRGSGSGDGFDSGFGDGSSSGFGSGSGSGDGSSSGFGSGSGSGDGDGLSSLNGQKVYIIDNTPTIITSVRKNVAKGYILGSDFSLTDCVIIKERNVFAHGSDLHEAYAALVEKLFEDMDEDERIEAFIKQFPDADEKYPASEFFVWHHNLTGSCMAGRCAFVKDGGYDLDNDMFTVAEFIQITENSYGGEIIKMLKAKLEEQKGR